jgi:hypothetical protein
MIQISVGALQLSIRKRRVIEELEKLEAPCSSLGNFRSRDRKSDNLVDLRPVTVALIDRHLASGGTKC